MKTDKMKQQKQSPSVSESEDEDTTQLKSQSSAVSTPVNTILTILKKNFLIKDFEDFFRILCYLIIGLFIFFINGLILFRQYSQERGIYNIPWHYNLLSVCVVFALFGFKALLKATLKDWIIENLNDKYVGPQREIRSKKILKWIQDSTYYSSTTLFSLIAFRDEAFMPSVFGGNGECSAILSGYPNFPTSNVVMLYHLIQFGCHTYSFFELVLFRRNEDSKFYEFTLHHFMAAGLIFYSGMFNFIHVSVLVLVIHDMGDIFVAGGRAYADMKFKNKYVLYTIMASALIVWIGSRIIVFPSCIIYTCWESIGNQLWGVWDIVKYTYYYMFVQLVILFFMHCYWTLFMLKIILDYAFKPVYKNHYDDKDFQKLKEKQKAKEGKSE